jgi:ATP-dependent DNA helicase HFM1/MER3
MRGATVKPQIAPSMFPIAKAPDTDTLQQPNTSRRRIESGQIGRKPSTVSDDFGDDGINDDELVKVSFGDLDFDHIENYPDPTNPITQKNTAKNKTAKDNKDKSNLNNKSYMNRTDGTTKDDDGESVQLPSGKWACNHPCKDKTACKHLCCKTGMDRPPKKKSTTKQIASGEHQTQSQPVNSSHQGKATQTKLQLTASKRKTSAPIEELDLTQPEKKKKADYAKYGPKDYRDLHQLHKTIQGKDLPSSLHNVMHKKPAYCYSQGGDHVLSFLDEPDVQRPLASSEYGDIQFDELSSHFDHSQHPAIQQDLMLMDESPRLHATNDHQSAVSVASLASETFDDEDSLLGDAMIGLADSQQLQATSDQNFDAAQVSGEVAELGISFDRPENDYEMVSDIASYDANDYDAAEGQSATPEYLSLRPSRPAFKPDLGSNYTSKARKGDFGSAKATIKRPEVKPSKQVTATAKPSSVEASLVRRGDGRAVHDDYDSEPSEGTMVKDNIIPDAFKDLEPWLFQEFGDIVELVDG